MFVSVKPLEEIIWRSCGFSLFFRYWKNCWWKRNYNFKIQVNIQVYFPFNIQKESYCLKFFTVAPKHYFIQVIHTWFMVLLFSVFSHLLFVCWTWAGSLMFNLETPGSEPARELFGISFNSQQQSAVQQVPMPTTQPQCSWHWSVLIVLALLLQLLLNELVWQCCQNYVITIMGTRSQKFQHNSAIA